MESVRTTWRTPVNADTASGYASSSRQTVGADLLIMGAFAHAPWQEALFGGGSHEALRASSLPILLTH
jgi:nucleotide-binding universal stress UspA family protein